MLNIGHMKSLTLIQVLLLSLSIAISSILISGCGLISFKAGNIFDASLLESDLRAGVSDSEQIKVLLGDPFGIGRALMPFHEKPRTVWTYYFEQGSIDLGGGESTDNRKYLFIFLDENIYEGYMWFDSKLN